MDFYASPTATWGENWKIYVKAHDQDGDIWEAQFNAKQPGVLYGAFEGHVILPRRLWKSIDGYFYLQIPPQPFRLGWVELTMTMQLVDRGNRKSQKLTFPLSIGSKSQEPPPEGFTEKPVQHIPILIRSSNIPDRRLFYLGP